MAKKRSINIIVGARDQSDRALRSVQRRLDRLKRAVFSTKNVIVGALGGVAIAAQLRGAVEAFGRQEMAVVNLTNAMRLLGVTSVAATVDMQKFAASIQRQTTIGDEAVLELAALGAGLGRLTGEALKKATVAAIGLSKVLKIDTVAAMRLVARAAVGDTSTLSRYGILLDETLTAQEKFNKVLEIGARGFALAQGEIFTIAGRLLQFKNSVGDLQEQIGGHLVPTLEDWLDIGRSVVEVLQGTDEQMVEVIDQAKTAGKVLLTVWAAPKIIGGIRVVTSGYLALTAATWLNTVASAANAAGNTAATITIWARVKATLALAAAKAALLGPLALVTAAVVFFISRSLAATAATVKMALAAKTLTRAFEAQVAARKQLAEASGGAGRVAAIRQAIAAEEKLLKLAQEDFAQAEREEIAGAALSRIKRRERLIVTFEEQLKVAQRQADFDAKRVAIEERRNRLKKQRAKIEARQAKERELVEKDAAQVAKENRRIAELQAKLIVDQTARAIRLVNLRFDAEIDAARRAKAETVRIERAKEIELQIIRQRAAELASQQAEAKRQAEQRALADRGRQEMDLLDQIEMLQIQLTKDGFARERALMQARHRREAAQAQAAGLDPNLVARKQRLELAVLAKQASAAAAGAAGAGAGGGAGAGIGQRPGLAGVESRFRRFGGRGMKTDGEKQVEQGQKIVKAIDKSRRSTEKGRAEIKDWMDFLRTQLPAVAKVN